MRIEIDNKERLCLLRSVRSEIRKGQLEKNSTAELTGKGWVTIRRKFGIKTLINLYSLESKLSRKGDIHE